MTAHFSQLLLLYTSPTVNSLTLRCFDWILILVAIEINDLTTTSCNFLVRDNWGEPLSWTATSAGMPPPIEDVLLRTFESKQQIYELKKLVQNCSLKLVKSILKYVYYLYYEFSIKTWQVRNVIFRSSLLTHVSHHAHQLLLQCHSFHCHHGDHVN